MAQDQIGGARGDLAWADLAEFAIDVTLVDYEPFPPLTGGQSVSKEERQQLEVADQAHRHLKMEPLDRLLINAIVDTQQGVDGALDGKDLNAAVNEFVRLNGRRHQSHFHAGFRDATFNCTMADLPAADTNQRRWYWSGAILGWARNAAWCQIVQALNENQTVRDLGDGADRASHGAGLEIAKALRNAERSAELPVFVSEELARQPDVHRLLIEAGTEALRSYTPSVARRFFALLMKCAESRGAPPEVAANATTVRRRMAHCLRLLGEHSRAEELLQGLIKDDHDINNQAMVHADLGLLKGHFLLLDNVRIPSDDTTRQDLVERLEAGEVDFRRAANIEDASFAAHGHYCLGVLELAKDGAGDSRYEIAHHHLECACAHFKSERPNYPASLVAHAELYLGVAKALLLTAADLEQAARLIAKGLKGDAEMPNHFIASTIDAIALSKSSIAKVAALLLNAGGDEALDALVQATAAQALPIVAKNLWKRAHRPNQSRVAKARDLRLSLSWFLRLGNVKRCRKALDELETLAVAGIAVDEFLELLSNQEMYDPVWTADDAATASARCLEAQGDYGNALAKLRTVFHHHTSANHLDDAAAILDWAHALALGEDAYMADMEKRYSALVEQDTELESRTKPPLERRLKPVVVLFIGGDESIAKSNYDVETRVREKDANVSVDFVAIGWTANWMKILKDEASSKLQKCDVVVISSVIRTTCGQHVRRLCSKRDIPWRFCYGAGQGVRRRQC